MEYGIAMLGCVRRQVAETLVYVVCYWVDMKCASDLHCTLLQLTKEVGRRITHADSHWELAGI